MIPSFDMALNALLEARIAATQRVNELSSAPDSLEEKLHGLRTECSELRNSLEQERAVRCIEQDAARDERAKFEVGERRLRTERI
jgi:hypothetical protein